MCIKYSNVGFAAVTYKFNQVDLKFRQSSEYLKNYLFIFVYSLYKLFFSSEQ